MASFCNSISPAMFAAAFVARAVANVASAVIAVVTNVSHAGTVAASLAPPPTRLLLAEPGLLAPPEPDASSTQAASPATLKRPGLCRHLVRGGAATGAEKTFTPGSRDQQPAVKQLALAVADQLV
jgi:hypothetical protein